MECTIANKIWTGFVPFFSQNHFDEDEGNQVVMVWFDGEPELYVTDGTDEAIENLLLYYEEDWGPGRVTRKDLTILDPAP